MHTKHNKLNKPTWSIVNNVGIASCGLLIALGCMAFLPIIDNSVSATPLTATAGVAITANAKATVAISVDDQVNIDITPTSSSNGDFVSGVSEVHVATNNTSGYSLYMAAVNETGNLEPIVGVSGGEEGSKAITTLTTNTIGSNFTGNTWGYNLSKDVGESGSDAASLTYSAVPTNTSQAIYTTDSANLEISDDYNLTFGVNIDSTLPAGTYTNSVLVSAVANPITVSELSQLTYMQDMTSSICNNTAEHATKQLVDTRDGKKYWVAKLKDGNCWMTQNLALDLSTDKTLTSVDTDLTYVTDSNAGSTYEFTPTSNTNSVLINGSAGFSSTLANQVAQHSWNFGKIVVVTPATEVLCNEGSFTSQLPISEIAGELTKVCTNSFADVSGVEWQPTFSAGSGRYLESDYSVVAVDESTKTYDAHYLVGNQYSWNAVTAGTGAAAFESSSSNIDALGSICPKGWRLPTASSESSSIPLPTEDNEFYQLLLAYGYPSIEDEEEWMTNASAGIGYTAALKGTDQIITNNPFYYTSTGYIDTNGSAIALRDAGRDGMYWSSTKRGGYVSARFYYSPIQYFPVAGFYGMIGMPARCLAR